MAESARGGGVLIYNASITSRLSKLMMRGISSQPTFGAIGALACLLIGAPAWVIAAQSIWVVIVAFVLLHELRRHDGLRPPVFFVTMTTGVSLLVLIYGGLRSPVLFALGTLAAGAAGMATGEREAARVRYVLLAVLAFAFGLELAGSSLASSPPALDRESPGPGFYVGTLFAFVTLAVGAVFGGLASRALRIGLDETEELKSIAREAHVAGIEGRSRDVMLLTGALARELSTPLQSIRRRAKAIAERSTNAATKERLAVLGDEVDRVERRLAHYLTFSRSSAANDAVAIAELFAELARAHEGVAAARGVHIAIDAEPHVISTDREKLLEILENLLLNAIDASPDGATVQLVARGSELEVLDEGPGLDRATEQSVFTPGFTTKAQGSGLGLVLSRRIAAQLGGTLSLENRAPRGCRARVVLGAPTSAMLKS